jgi:hypothetical protein
VDWAGHPLGNGGLDRVGHEGARIEDFGGPRTHAVVLEAVARAKLFGSLMGDRMQAVVDVSREVGGLNGPGQAIVGSRGRRRAEDEHNPQQQVSHCGPA